MLNIETSKKQTVPSSTSEWEACFGATSALSLRDVPKLITQYVKGTKTLDYNCGRGRLTPFLKSTQLEVYGVDANKQDIADARRTHPDINYDVIESITTRFPKEHFDVVVSRFGLTHFANRELIGATLAEIHRLLKKDGVFIYIANSDEFFCRNWLSVINAYSQNRDIQSGQLGKVKVEPFGTEYENYFWSEADYRELFAKSDLTLITTSFPKGQVGDTQAWRDETQFAPYAVYVLQK